MKILVTGNPTYGIAEAISRILSVEHQLDFVSKTYNNIDLNDQLQLSNFVINSHNYDIVINNARLHSFNQVKLLQQVWQSWAKSSKEGLIINVGSSADQGRDLADGIYGAEKSALKRLSELYAFRSTFKKSNIKVTYLSFGWADTPLLNRVLPNVKKHSADEIANIIKWVIDYPVTTSNINEIRVEVTQ